MITVYYFDGSSGCDRCQSATGYSFEPPARPHPHCDCPIIEEDAVLDDFDIEYRNLVVLEDAYTVEEEQLFDNCDSNADETISIVLEEDEGNDISSELEEFAGDQLHIPETDEDEVEIEVPARNFAAIEIEIARYAADVHADVYMVGTLGNETFETELEPESGHYEKNVRFERVDSEVGPCMLA